MTIDDTDLIRQNLAAVRGRIDAACDRAGRSRDEVRLLLATKTVSAERVRIAIQAGATLIAENRVQEVRPKAEALADLEYESHFIGHLQSNKINALVPYVSCIQSVDRMSLARKLQKRLEREGEQRDVLLQVNTSREDSKFGLSPEDLPGFARQVAELDALKIRGLMTIGLFAAEPEEARPSLALLRELAGRVRELNLDGVSMDELSMGMSGDLEVAIEEGSTIVRVGTAVFGDRGTPDSAYWPPDQGPAPVG
ncbi:MAG: YggS family pyridoxal phosphate-dependent enzyme [Solirubrobacterales bacterium]|nr:YggS family pyridoxal phosphate-dependent enzyme [Solirubrobacterales bacterium]